MDKKFQSFGALAGTRIITEKKLPAPQDSYWNPRSRLKFSSAPQGFDGTRKLDLPNSLALRGLIRNSTSCPIFLPAMRGSHIHFRNPLNTRMKTPAIIDSDQEVIEFEVQESYLKLNFISSLFLTVIAKARVL